jgi:hypothetical protein
MDLVGSNILGIAGDCVHASGRQAGGSSLASVPRETGSEQLTLVPNCTAGLKK